MSSPPPAERDAADAAAKAREQEEQAALPYKWTQTVQDVDITVTVPGNYKGKDLDVKISKSALRVAVKGGEVFVDVSQAGSQGKEQEKRNGHKRGSLTE